MLVHEFHVVAFADKKVHWWDALYYQRYLQTQTLHFQTEPIFMDGEWIDTIPYIPNDLRGFIEEIYLHARTNHTYIYYISID